MEKNNMMKTKWVRSNNFRVCVYGIRTTPEEQILQMSYKSLSDLIDWPMPFELFHDDWIKWTTKLMKLNQEILEESSKK
jgi:hypothetical protein